MAADNMRANLRILPRELALIILSKLPFKPILRFKAVCKEWLDIVTSDPTFAKTQYDVNNSQVIVCPKAEIDYYKTQSGWSSKVDPGRMVVLGGSWHGFDVVNSCKGFLLMRKRFWGLDEALRPYALYNPLTNETVFLPHRPESKNLYTGSSSHCGLGFSPVMKRFKVVLLVRDLNQDAYKLQMYTVGKSATGAWRTVPILPEGYCRINEINKHNTIELNGVLHWISRSNRSIACFDVEKEELGELSTPFIEESWEYHINNISSIAIYKGLICLVRSVYCGSHYEMETWVMKEYGINESWIRLSVVNLNYALKSTSFERRMIAMMLFRDPKLVDIFDTGERIFLATECCPWSYHLISYNPMKESFENFPFLEAYKLKMTIDLYTPSFFSLKDFVPN